MLVFMGGFGVWTQVWSKGSCVGKVGSRVRFPSPAPYNKKPFDLCNNLYILKNYSILLFLCYNYEK